MISAVTGLLSCALALLPGEPIEPSDDVWVYTFAADQTTDPFLRVWGTDGASVAPVVEGSLTFSYSCLKFDLPEGLDPARVREASLTLTHVADAGFDEEATKANPIEARALSASFNEADWDLSMAPKVHPVIGSDALFGSGWTRPSDDEKPFKVTIDLLQGPGNFRKALAQAMKSNRSLALALTTKMNPEGAGESSIYKFYSRHNEPALRPVLQIVSD